MGVNSSECLLIRFMQNKWETVPNMRLERSGPAVSAIDGFLYVIGKID